MATLSSSAMTAAATPPATVAFTTPQNYAQRLSHLLALKGHAPLWCPTLSVGPTPQTISSLRSYLRPPALEPFSAIAFTSRAGIAAFSSALADVPAPLLGPHGRGAFVVAALGKDSELLDADLLSRICADPRRIETLVPQVASPRGLVESLGRGDRRRILCPVPLVVGIEEPPVVPEFIGDLEAMGWAAVRVGAYETRWLGEDCAAAIVGREEEGEGLDAIVFTSSGEVEGLLKSLKAGFGWEWEDVRRRWPELVVAAHGPVTAAGAERLGVGVDVVGHKFESFGGVVEALSLKLQSAITSLD
ncbi:hypothetical protein BT93_D0531 [Corymbia citriodora subsp. variegata]|nr:hypothetical protein BT93_D0531 [Corymbia citriodora subsp. variegata]